MSLLFKNIVNDLPVIPAEDLQQQIALFLQASNKVIVVLDDDPTGTQTVHDVPVLTVWDDVSIEAEIKRKSRLFFILTNSRSMTASEADLLHNEIALNIHKAFSRCKKEFILISRGDSTLRGHYPNDVNILAKGIGYKNFSTAIIPAFFEGGRFTITDVHYVQEGEMLIPAAETSFAKDKAFGYTQSNLKNWVEEKTNGHIKSGDVYSFSIHDLRKLTTEQLNKKLSALPERSTIIVNAADYYDLQKFALVYLQSGVQVLFRTAASFVKAIAACNAIPLLNNQQLVAENNNNGGLIIVGSYVEKTNKQLNRLLQNFSGEIIELHVQEIINDFNATIKTEQQINQCLAKGLDVLVYTSRQLLVSTRDKENLSVNQQVADCITRLVAALSVQPKWFIAKGGITSSDIATKALGIKRAMVLGQALPGVPVWKTGLESKFPGMPYIIFPGNVGDDDALHRLYSKLK